MFDWAVNAPLYDIVKYKMTDSFLVTFERSSVSILYLTGIQCSSYKKDLKLSDIFTNAVALARIHWSPYNMVSFMD